MLNFNVEFIHPYGRNFLFYTDKPWERGVCMINGKNIRIMGEKSVIIPLVSVMSIDKRITLPPVREGRATLLIEYINIIKKEKVYTLLSGDEGDIREIKKRILVSLIKNLGVMYLTGGNWERGVIDTDGKSIIFNGKTRINIPIESVIKFDRLRRKMGFNTVSTIYIQYGAGDLKKDIEVLIPPLKRDFFWQLINLMMEEYIMGNVISRLTRAERMILMLVHQGANVNEILAKHHFQPNEFKEIVDKLDSLGLINKIIILRITERGRKVVEHITEED